VTFEFAYLINKNRFRSKKVRAWFPQIAQIKQTAPVQAIPAGRDDIGLTFAFF
jgi:hypothetical protein